VQYKTAILTSLTYLLTLTYTMALALASKATRLALTMKNTGLGLENADF